MSNDDSNWPDRPPPAPPAAPPDYVVQQEVAKSRGFGRFVALGVGLLFLGGVGVVAVAGFGGSRDGAGSPEAAVEALSLALNNQDVIAALEILAPSEVGTAADLYPRILDLAVQEDALEDVDWLRGVDVQVTGLQTRTTQLHDGVALVELVSGTFSVTIDPDVADPIFLDGGQTSASITVGEVRDSLTELAEQQAVAQEEYLGFPFAVQAPDGIFLMTVKRDGGWFVSPFYTGAEFGRQMLDLPPADFAASREDAAPGAGTAGGVIEALTGVVNDNRLEDLVQGALEGDSGEIFQPLNAFVPPDEIGVFLDYAPAYLSLVEDFVSGGETSLDQMRRDFADAVDEFQLEGEAKLEIDVREEVRPDGAVVLYLGSGRFELEASAVDPDTRELSVFSAEASWEGLCGRADIAVDNDPQEQVGGCAPDEVSAALDDIFVVVDQVDGDWYLSYVETALAYGELFLEGQLE